MEFKQHDILIPAEEIRQQIGDTLAKVKELVPGYDPFKGHRPEDAASGKSTFDKSGTDEEILEWLYKRLDFSSYRKTESNETTVILVFKAYSEVGTAVTTTLEPDAIYEIDTPHGDYLQAKGPVVKTESRTNDISFVVTNEGDNNKKIWCLASVYPGLPDAPGDWSGLKRGEVYDGCAIGQRNIRRTVVQSS